MFYKELNNIELIHYDTEKSIQKLKNEFGINAPDSVIKQFYLDLSNKSDFLEFYGNINLNSIKWALVDVPTKDLLDIGDAATCPDYLVEISRNAALYNELGDDAIDSRKDVAEYWKVYGTWKTPPIFLDGTKLKKPTKKLHLVEGHTRLGCLKGVYTERLIELADFHQIYYGEFIRNKR